MLYTFHCDGLNYKHFWFYLGINVIIKSFADVILFLHKSENDNSLDKYVFANAGNILTDYFVTKNYKEIPFLLGLPVEPEL